MPRANLRRAVAVTILLVASAGVAGASAHLSPTLAIDLAIDLVGPSAPSEYAAAPLDAVLDELAAPGNDRLLPPPSDDALRAYVRGRELLASGDASAAITAFSAATEAFPREAPLWRALGDAQREAGLQASAVTSYTRAAELGLAEPGPLTIAGVALLDRGEAGTAAGLLATAARSPVLSADAGLAAVTWAGLGEALLRIGRSAAGAEAIARGLPLPERLSRPTPVLPELARLERAQGHLRFEAARALLEVARPDEAVEQLTPSLELPAYARPGAIRALTVATARCRDPQASADAAGAAIMSSFGEGDAPNLIDIIALATLTRSMPAARAVDLQAAARLASRLESRPDGSASRAAAFALLDAAVSAARGDADALIDHALALGIGSDPEPAAACGDVALAMSDSAEAAAAVARRLAAARPDLADRVARSLAFWWPDAAEAIVAEPGESRTLAAAAAMLLNKTSEGLALAHLDDRPAATIWDARVAVLLHAAAGEWTVAEASLQQLRAALDAAPDQPGGVTALAEGLIAMQRFDAAIAALAGPAMDGQIYPLVLAAQTALNLGDAVAGERFADAAARVDPLDARVARVQFAVFQAAGPAKQAEAVAYVQALRDRRPSSPVVAALSAEELVRSGLTLASASVWWELMLAEPVDEQPVLGLLNAAREAARRNDTRVAARLEPMLRERAERHRGSPLATLALARLLAQQDRAKDALLVLAAAPQSQSVSALRESLLRDPLGRPEEADALRRERLLGRRRGIGEALQLAAWCVEGGAPGELSAPAVIELIPTDARFTAPQAQAARSIVAAAAGAAEAAPDDTASLARFDDLTAALVRRGVTIDPPVHERRLVALAAGDADVARLTRAVDDTARQHPALRIAAAVRVARLMAGTSRRVDAFAVLRHVAFGPTGAWSWSEEGFDTLLQMLGGLGEVDDARAIIDDAQRGAAMDRAIARARDIVTPGDGSTPPHPADIAYAAAVLASASDRVSTAESLYRLALELDPSHAWSANNLGYTLLERDGIAAVEQAAPLLELAIERLPGEASVIDSLGWLRYLQGRLTDPLEADPSRPASLGAISLLERADRDAATAGDTGDGTLAEHLGDAYAAVGRDDDARAAWRRALDAATAAVENMRGLDVPAVLRRAAESVAQRARDKIAALDAGTRPAITPTPAAPWSLPATAPGSAATP